MKNPNTSQQTFNQQSQASRTYTVPEIAKMLQLSVRKAYNLCNATTDFRVLHLGKSIRVHKISFDEWFERC